MQGELKYPFKLGLHTRDSQQSAQGVTVLRQPTAIDADLLASTLFGGTHVLGDALLVNIGILPQQSPHCL